MTTIDVKVTGDTYAHRGTLRAKGFRWNPGCQAWVKQIQGACDSSTVTASGANLKGVKVALNNPRVAADAFVWRSKTYVDPASQSAPSAAQYDDVGQHEY